MEEETTSDGTVQLMERQKRTRKVLVTEELIVELTKNAYFRKATKQFRLDEFQF